MTKRGQASMEFLATYGWAIVVVLVAISALAYFGVLSPSMLSGESCTLFPGFACKDFTVSPDGKTITIKMQASRGEPITITTMKLDQCASCITTIKGLTLPQTITDGEIVTINFTNSAPIAQPKSKLKATIQVNYRIGDNLGKFETGKLVVDIPSTASGPTTSATTSTPTTSASTSSAPTTSATTSASTTTPTTSASTSTPTTSASTSTPTTSVSTSISTTSSTTSTSTSTSTTIPCSLNNPLWALPNADEGQLVNLSLSSSNCIGETIIFEVWEYDTLDSDDPVSFNPASKVVSVSTVQTTWTAEWQNDCLGTCNPPEYYFKAYVASNPSIWINSASNLNTFSTTTVLTTTSTSTSIATTTSVTTTTIIYAYTNLTATADAALRENTPTTPLGDTPNNNEVQNTAGSRYYTIIRFNVSVPGTPVEAKLFLKTAGSGCSTNSPYYCITVNAYADNTWNELTITWNTKLTEGSLIGSLEDLTTNNLYYGMLVSGVTSNGLYSFMLIQTANPSDWAVLGNRHSANFPRLQIKYAT